MDPQEKCIGFVRLPRKADCEAQHDRPFPVRTMWSVANFGKVWARCLPIEGADEMDQHAH